MKNKDTEKLENILDLYRKATDDLVLENAVIIFRETILSFHKDGQITSYELEEYLIKESKEYRKSLDNIYPQSN